MKIIVNLKYNLLSWISNIVLGGAIERAYCGVNSAQVGKGICAVFVAMS